jgi:hypothetical protein
MATATAKPGSTLLKATVIGTVLQIAMVVAGHSNASVAGLFAIGGMGISLLAGLLYGAWSGTPKAVSAGWGAIAGGVCALLGIAVSWMLGDVPVSLLALGTLSSTVTGAIGGLAGAAIRPRTAGVA